MVFSEYLSITGVIYLPLTLVLFFVTKRFFSFWHDDRSIGTKDIYIAFLFFSLVCLTGTLAGTIFVGNTLWIQIMIIASSIFLSLANGFLGHLFLYYIKSKISPWLGFGVITFFGLFVTVLTIYLPFTPVVEKSGGINWGLPFSIMILRTIVYVLGILPLLVILPPRIKAIGIKSKKNNNVVLLILLMFILIIVFVDFIIEPLINADALLSEVIILIMAVVSLILYGIINERIITIREKKLSSIIHQLSDGFALYNEDGIISIWNKANEKITGIGSKDAIVKPVWDIFYSLLKDFDLSDDYLLSLKGYFLSGFEPDLEFYKKADDYKIMTKSGEIKDIQITIFPVITFENRHVGFLLKDVTHDKVIEKQLIAAIEKAS